VIAVVTDDATAAAVEEALLGGGWPIVGNTISK